VVVLRLKRNNKKKQNKTKELQNIEDRKRLSCESKELKKRQHFPFVLSVSLH